MSGSTISLFNEEETIGDTTLLINITSIDGEGNISGTGNFATQGDTCIYWTNGAGMEALYIT